MCILAIVLNCINLDDNSFSEDDPNRNTIIHVRWLGKLDFKKAKYLKNN